MKPSYHVINHKSLAIFNNVVECEKMKREFSAGGIVFNDQGQVLLIRNASMPDPTRSYWGFPKGHLDRGESSKEAALREILEEVGIKAEIVEKVGDSKYVFEWQGEKTFKVVTIFLMQTKSDQIMIQEDEIAEANWFDPEEALKKISFSNDKQLLKKALELKNGRLF